MALKLRKMNMVKQIPNFLTLCNLFCGSLSILLAFNDKLWTSAIVLLVAFHADIFDGFTARMLKAQTKIGKELDSLADMVSFGLAPAVILHVMLLNQSGQDSFSFQTDFNIWFPLLIPFLMTIFAALRLAKFNIDERQSEVFIGLPTPANALMVLSLPLIAHSQADSFLITWFSNTWVIVAYAITVSVLMIAPVYLYSLKLKGFNFRLNKYRYFFALMCVIILITLRHTGLFLIIVLYFAYGAILGWLQKQGKIT